MRRTPKTLRGERIYAIGDIHGRLDLFASLVARIKEDAMLRPVRRTKLILIGDVIDRGPASAALVRHLHRLSLRNSNLIVLRGNHEQMMIDAIDGDLGALDAWIRFGGRQTLQSWGISDDIIRAAPLDLLQIIRATVPNDILMWLRRLPFCHRSGDFFFVHAGIRPGIALNAQSPVDMMWIREDFLDAECEHPAVIVHGHSICEDGPEMLKYRIGLDTGAYRTGRLSAVGFESSAHWPIEVWDRFVWHGKKQIKC